MVEGRDITTVVFPDARVKIFSTASLDERARRRGDEGEESVARRDDADSTREASPLRQADDAIVLDTTGRSVDDVVEEIVQCLKNNDLQLEPRKTLVHVPSRAPASSAVSPRLFFRPTVVGARTSRSTGPVLIAPIHRSNVDFAFTLFISPRKVFFMAKDSLFRVPLLGPLDHATSGRSRSSAAPPTASR